MLLQEIIRFMWKRKMWWLAPILIMLAIIGLLIFFAQSAVLSPFVYTLF